VERNNGYFRRKTMKESKTADQLVLDAPNPSISPEPAVCYTNEQPQALAVQEPMDKWERLLQLAVERNAGAEQFAMLVDAITKARREDARLQFETSLNRFKEHLPEVFKTKKVSFPTKDGGETSYWHAEADKASEIIGAALLKEGIIHTWRPSEGANGRCIMTCVFRAHGHVEDMATIGGPPESSGTKNNLQAIGSTLSYLQRYSLFAASGIVPKGADNDGRTTAEGMSEDAITDYCILLQDSADFEQLKKNFAEGYQKARGCGDGPAAKRIQKVYEEKKKTLWAAKNGDKK
jgi:hypothetical protein